MSVKRIIAGGQTKQSSNALFASSTNGTSWTIIDKSALTGGVNWNVTIAIKYWANRWVAVGKGTMNNGTVQMPIITSSDGDNWNPVTFNTPINLPCTINAVDYSGTVWLAGGSVFYNNSACPLLYKSTNGINWTTVYSHTDGYTGSFSDLQWVDNMWLVVGNRYTSADNMKYIYRSNNYDASNMQTISWNKQYGNPEAVTNFKHNIYIASQRAPFLRKYNGSWSNVNNPLTVRVTDTSIYRNNNGGDERIVICGWVFDKLSIAWSDNGSSFTLASPNNLYDSYISCLSKFFGNSILAGAGYSGTNNTDGIIFYSTNKGENWQIITDTDLKDNFSIFLNIEVAFM